MPAYLHHRIYRKDTPRVCAQIQSAATSVTDGHNCHSWVLLGVNMLVVVVDKDEEARAYSAPRLLLDWSVFA
jgi:hypothetical protein